MADGLNDARAIRVAEIIQDYRNLQIHLSQINVAPPAHETNLLGYAILRRCLEDAQAVLTQPFATTPTTGEPPEALKVQLQRIIADACTRRFRCQRAYFRANAALRCIQGRNAVLQGQAETLAHSTALQAVDENLRAEITAITDAYVHSVLVGSDTSQGKWLAEDPSLDTIQRLLL